MSTATNVTNLSSSTQSSVISSHLSEVVVDGGKRTITPSKVKLKASGKVAPTTTSLSKTGGKLGLSLDADWTGESCDWEDYSSGSDTPNTDDDYDFNEPVQQASRILTFIIRIY